MGEPEEKNDMTLAFDAAIADGVNPHVIKLLFILSINQRKLWDMLRENMEFLQKNGESITENMDGMMAELKKLHAMFEKHWGDDE